MAFAPQRSRGPEGRAEILGEVGVVAGTLVSIAVEIRCQINVVACSKGAGQRHRLPALIVVRQLADVFGRGKSRDPFLADAKSV